MALSKGFRWHRRWQYSACHDDLFLDREIVAMLLGKIDGGQFARLECQRKGVDPPMIIRHCTSYEADKAGVGIWAARHEGRLGREVTETIASQPPHEGAMGLSKDSLRSGCIIVERIIIKKG